MSAVARLDLHCHTRYSGDCFVSLAEVTRIAAERGITHLAITDHDSCECYRQEGRRKWPVEVIFGEEVTLGNGTHLIALGITGEIKSKSLADALREIRDAGGCILVPHPFKKGSGIMMAGDERTLLAEFADAIEVCNSKLTDADNRRAFELARELHKPMTAGSDAHFGYDVGDAVLEAPATGDWRTMIRNGKGRVMMNRHIRQKTFDEHLMDDRVSNLAPSIRRYVPKPVRMMLKRTLHRAVYQPRVKGRDYALEELRF